MTQKTLILIDGHALAYRSFFALERTGMKTTSGEHTWAVYGFIKSMVDLLKKVKPDAIAVSFDIGRKTFRNDEYPEYKANRESMPDSLREQMAKIHKSVEMFNIPIYEIEGFEADDVIGTICEKARKLNHKTIILTGDKDSFQLIDDDNLVSVLVPGGGDLIKYDRDKVYEKMGVWPEKIIDYKGLAGDSSDNIPGVKGVGAKTAIKLINEFGTVENVVENIENVTGKSLKEKLERDKEIALLSKHLATIKRDVPIDFDFESTHLEMPDVEKLADFLRELEFNNLLKMLPTILKPFNNGVIPNISTDRLTIAKPEIQNNNKGQLALDFSGKMFQEENEQTADIIEKTTYTTIDNKELFNEFLEKIKNAKLISLDTETTSVIAINADLVGISFAISPQIIVKDDKLFIDKEAEEKLESFYLPVGHKEGTQLDLDMCLNKLKPILEDESKYKILQNAKYEINVLKNYDIDLKGIIFDTMIASYIKNPTFNHGLKNQSIFYLKHEMQPIEELIGKGKTAITMDNVSIKDAASYACDDARATLELGKYYTDCIKGEQNSVLYDIEIPLIEVIANIERNGVSLDLDFLKVLSDDLQEKISETEATIFVLADEEFNVNSPKQVGVVLFEKLELPTRGKTKTKTGYSTGAKVLESLIDEHPIVELLLEHRHLSKLKSTYIDALPLLVNEKTKRIHTSFNQTATTTGRLSSSNPNLQNIPIRTEIGNSIREAFVPEDAENNVLLAADYSQIELRLLAHFAKDPVLMKAFDNNQDIHAITASKVFATHLGDVTKDMRRQAKAVNFGIIYGQTSYGLSEGVGITPAEAKRFIEKYFETYPKIKEYMEKTKAEAHNIGYVSTMFGRRRYLKDDLASRNRMLREFAERAAVNTPLQGTAADLIKIAMIDLYKKLKASNLKSKIILQVHDELVLEVPKSELEEVKKLVTEAMELEQPLTVPLKVDMNSGKNWREAH